MTRFANTVLDFVFGKLLGHFANKPPQCGTCKKGMEKTGAPRLYLIPIMHDHDYAPSASYYQKNCTPIGDEREIPTGQRACRFWVYTCPGCGQQKIMVEDFLKVRTEELIKKRSVYDYSAFSSFLLGAGQHRG